MNSASADSVARVERLFRRAERAIKRAERLTHALPTAAVNQLRYAGRHLLQADSDASGEALRKAANHCVRAWYDAFDAILLRHLEAIARFEDSGFPRDAILHYYPNYEAELPLIKRAQDLFRGTPPTQALTVERMVDRLRMAKCLSKIVDRLRMTTQELRKTYLERSESEAEQRENARIRRDCISFLATLAGCLIGIFGILLTAESWLSICLSLLFIVFAILAALLLFRALR